MLGVRAGNRWKVKEVLLKVRIFIDWYTISYVNKGTHRFCKPKDQEMLIIIIF